MNADSFKNWFVNRFLNCLEEGSIIIMGNAGYHSTIADKVPNTGSRKKDIQGWLRKNCIDYDPTENHTRITFSSSAIQKSRKGYGLDQIAN
jgi:hypothetical protein